MKAALVALGLLWAQQAAGAPAAARVSTSGESSSTLRGGGLVGSFERFEQRVPGERGALDPHRELHDALQRLQVTERDVPVEVTADGSDVQWRTEPGAFTFAAQEVFDGAP